MKISQIVLGQRKAMQVAQIFKSLGCLIKIILGMVPVALELSCQAKGELDAGGAWLI